MLTIDMSAEVMDRSEGFDARIDRRPFDGAQPDIWRQGWLDADRRLADEAAEEAAECIDRGMSTRAAAWAVLTAGLAFWAAVIYGVWRLA